MITLYHYPYSQHARRVVSLLEEAKLEYKLVAVAMDKNEHMSAEYSAINPNQQIPTLIDGDLKIHESNAILRYLSTKHELDNWYPTDLKIRALVEQWLDWNQCRLSPPIIDIVVNKLFMGEQADHAAIKRGEESIKNLAIILEEGLDGTDYLVSNKPTIADLSVASNIFQLSLADIMLPGSNIESWYQRIKQIKGFQKSLAAIH